MFNSVQGGYIGNIAGNPFGSDFVVPQQRKPVPGGPQMSPLKQPPARVFPPDQPGREGAIDVRLAMGMPGMNIGNVGGMSAMMQPSTGTLDSFSRYAQAMAGMQNPGNATQEQEEISIDPLAGSQGPFNPFAAMQASARKAGFDKKTVS
jgi:hypothetical protein